MKKLLAILCVLGICRDISAQTYLPLTAGSGSALTGNLYTPGIQINGFDLSKYLYVGGDTRIDGSLTGVSAMFGSSGSFGNTVSVTASSITGLAYNFDGTAYGGRTWGIGDGTTVNGTFAIRDRTAGADRLSITSAGNIGIGISSPSQPLHIAKDGGSSGMALEVQDLNATNTGIGYFGVYQGDTYMQSGSSGKDIRFYDVGNELMRIKSGGNVGIGTTSPTEKLSVNGKIQAKEIKVETGWSDFVFDRSYKLPDLKETEQFIKANKHLPEIPSAKEVADNGINLGEMNAKLLQKIEELTLYLIDQSKEIKDLRSEVNQLTSK